MKATSQAAAASSTISRLSVRLPNNIGLQIPRDLGPPAAGALFLQTLNEAAPNFMPAVYSSTEPIRTPVGESSPESIWSKMFFWKALDRRVEGGVDAGAFRRTGHTGVWIADGRGTADQDEDLGVLVALAKTFAPTFGFLHRINRREVRPGGVPSFFDRGSHPPHVFVGPDQLVESIPELFWATIFGARYIELFGLSRLLETPVYKVELVTQDCVLLQLTSDLNDMDNEFDQVEAIRRRAKAHLGTGAFFEIAS